jgi:hypothetical protein
MLNLKQNVERLVLVAVSVVAPVAAFATPAGDYDAITGAVDFVAVGTAIGAIAALLAVPMVIRKGSKMVLGFIR